MIKKAKIEKPVSSDYVCKLIGVSRPALHKSIKADTIGFFKFKKVF